MMHFVHAPGGIRTHDLSRWAAAFILHEFIWKVIVLQEVGKMYFI